jgi:transposase
VESIDRLAGVVKRWREEGRFAGDQEIYDRLEAWRAQDAHLLEWASNLRDQLLLRRREVYRVAAARLSERYRTCVVEELNLAAFARREGPAEDAPDKARLMRHRAALSTLRQALGRRMRTVIVPSAYTTQECHICGYVQKLFDAAKQLRYRCEACGSEWDQDENAAQNLLRRYLDQRDDRKTTGGARATW